MKIERRSGDDERRILIAMIVDPVVCGRVASLWVKDVGMFASDWANLVGGWCVLYHGRYGAAPGRAIESMFRAWCEKGRDKDTIALVEKFLKSLSREYEAQKEELNSQYIVDLAGTYFNRVAVARHAEALQGHLDTGDVTAALEAAGKFGRVEIGGGAYIDPMRDGAAMQRAFEHNKECLIEYPGALGEFFSRALVRDSFVAGMAKEKGKKSFWLLDFVFMAVKQRRKVAYIECGDLSEEQVMQRWGAYAAGHPIEPCTAQIPISIERAEGAEAHVEYKEKVFKTGITHGMAMAACARILEQRCKTDQQLVRLSCHPNGTVSVAGIRTTLQRWEREGWVPDIIAIDYADILMPPTGHLDSRHQTNAIWQQLRGLSQSTHTLVLTMTQADAGSYGAHTLSRKNFSEDKRKYAHVTALFGINDTPEEYELGIQRLNWLVTRSFRSSERRCVYVAGCADIARPALKSCW